MEAVRAAGARIPIRYSRVTTSVDGSTFQAPLPGTALGLSRYTCWTGFSPSTPPLPERTSGTARRCGRWKAD